MNIPLGVAGITVLLLYNYFSWSLILILIIIAVTGLMAFGLYEKNTNRICNSKKMLFGRTVLVSGGTTGIGLEIANDMAHRGAKVIITCPFTDEGRNAKKHIEKSSGSDKVVFKLLNLSSFKSVRKFAADILKSEDRLDILINNAGCGVPGTTEDGLHNIMQVNYFGTFLLTVLLLPLLKKTGQPSEPSRIVNTSSVQHRVSTVDYENWNNSAHFNDTCMYGNSKLCVVMFTMELSKMLKDANVVVNVVDPGAVGGTNIFKALGRLGKILSTGYTIICKNVWVGAQTVLHVSLSDEAAKVSGQYFMNCQISSAGKVAFDKAVASRLWAETAKLVKLTDEECPPSVFRSAKWNFEKDFEL